MDRVDVKFGEWIEKGFNLYKANFAPLVLASLFVILISSVSLLILSGPMMAGLIMMILNFYDEKQPPPTAGNVFRGFDCFLNAFLFFLVWGLIVFAVSIILSFVPCIGTILVIFISYSAQALLMFGLFLIVDRKMDFWPASMESINIVKTNFWPFLGLAVVAGIIGSIGSVACVIGVVLTMPIQMCIIACAYRESTGKGIPSGENL